MAFASWFRRRPEAEPLPEVTPELALGALMVRMAKADHDYNAAEIGVMDKVLAAQFDLNPVEAAKMRATCERLEHDAPDTDQFAKLVHDNISVETRRALIKALVDVARADGVDRREESTLLTRLAAELEVGAR
ncbi:putative tellurite resistance protein B-like protein [Litoreibacter ponti]|uniref:Putative tellurite resistance protein B-like protein n=1 Tax=Litoreibacter ponti TaxID=1510457 RepID=A0A2T6BK60_9RHOB|nr:TerB family tellurite resistance protein [Litoreibacter ponti]PTX56436.1 putative tellurite resistance protein B-like protein [Litoreibacter ponti]